jgi:hypothetical protein
MFSLQQLNQRIHDFSFGMTESKNRPSSIAIHHLTSSGELKQSGQILWQNCGVWKGSFFPEQNLCIYLQT